MIRKIVLENFMSHKRTVIEPAAGLTVLTGPNNCGKSAVVVALQALCFNDGHKSFVRHGERESRVVVETDEGHRIEWIRKGDVVRYKVNGREVDRLRGRVPEDLDELLRLPKVVDDKGDKFDIHFAEQKRPIFLLDASGSKAATFFASSSDAGRLIQMQRRHKEKVRDGRRDEVDLARRVDAGKKSLERFEAVPKLETSMTKAEALYETIQREGQAVTSLVAKAIALEDLGGQVEELGALSITLNQAVAPPRQDDTGSLSATISRIESRLRAASVAAGACAGMKELSPPPGLARSEALSDSIQQLHRKSNFKALIEARLDVAAKIASPPELASETSIRAICHQLAGAQDAMRMAGETASRTAVELEAAANQVRAFVQANPTCPTCGGKLQADRLLVGGHVHA